jgi:photosystem II stability/assembly factor-like uncharacterized protein
MAGLASGCRGNNWSSSMRSSVVNRFERVIQILDESIGGPDIGIAAHGAFWRGLTREQFVVKKVFNRDVVVGGDGVASNLVKALKGEAPFGEDLENPPPGASIPRMPFGFPPVSDEDIGFIKQWIDDGCPEDPLPSNATLTWQPTNAPAATRYDDIWFVTPRLGWAVNSNGQILLTADEGATWEEQFHVTTEDGNVWLRCIGFATESQGWVGSTTPEKRLFETSDGGITWNLVTNLPAEAPMAVCGLSVVNESVVYASGTNYPFPQVNRPPRMMKTVDGGVTWSAWDMTAHASLLVDTYFTSPEHGWVVGGKVHPVIPGQQQCDKRPDRANIKPVVLYTEDGGQTWVNRVANIEEEFPLGEWGWKIFFLNNQVGFVSLENFYEGAILKTTDGGQTWKRLPINDAQKNANLEGIGFADDDHGWVGGWGSADFRKGSSSQTTDGGKSWSGISWGDPTMGEFINRFRFFGNPVTLGYASGDTVYRYSETPLPVSRQVAAALETRLFDSAEPAESSRPIRIPLAVPAEVSRLSINVWDRFGDRVRQLTDETDPSPGSRIAEWDVTDHTDAPLELGYYIVRVTADDRSESKILWITD